MCLLRPILQLPFRWGAPILKQYQDDGVQASEIGKTLTQNAFREVIKQQTEAYILSKAEEYGADIHSSVQLSNNDIPIPVSIQITGIITDEAKIKIEKIITEEFGIPKECQYWILEN